jgi:4-hydroxyphenylpyruvate dioxygenase
MTTTQASGALHDSDVARIESGVCGVEYVELYVANVVHAVHFYRNAVGLAPVFYCGPETGVHDRVSYVLQRGDIRLVLTSPLSSDGPVAERLHQQGDTVHDVAFRVRSVVDTFSAAVSRGARPVAAPEVVDPQRSVMKATLATFGKTVHSLIERRDQDDTFASTFKRIERTAPPPDIAITGLDHLAVTLEEGTLDLWVEHYRRVFGFRQSQEEIVAGEYSGMNSKVVESRSGAVKMPLVEPVSGARRSPVEEYLRFHHAAGVHHLALLTDDIVATVVGMEERGVEFMPTPPTYFEALEARIGPPPIPLEALQRGNILVDADGDGYLLQVFTRPLHTRPTFALEVIQRVRSRGFGAGNVKALFEALDREQLRRRNA